MYPYAMGTPFENAMSTRTILLDTPDGKVLLAAGIDVFCLPRGHVAVERSALLVGAALYDLNRTAV